MGSFLKKLENLSIRRRLWLMAIIFIATLFVTATIALWNQYHHHQKTQLALQQAELVTQAVDQARRAQVSFKKQVQEWKNILLRAHESALREKYLTQFEKQELEVYEHLDKLKLFFAKFGLKTELVQKAIDEHHELGKKYRQALTFLKTGSVNTTFLVDSLVRGIDRPATDYIDELVKIIEEVQTKKFSGLLKEAQLNFWAVFIFSLTTSFLAIWMLFIVAYFTINTITNPLRQTIGIFESISNENFQNYIEENRKDEIGEMWRSLALMQNRLRERTEALNRSREALENTLREVQAMKEKQDGDYFLTSLLAEPLCSVKAKNPAVFVSHYIRQKKVFTFRKWTKEIGGDINIVDEIKLKGKDYLVILNADAMGKSIQGAGGAIVMGALFRSIIERTKMSAQVSLNSPERWLKNTWSEIQKVLESFDGSMLVSAVIALLDLDRGVLYSLNAEHPPVVLLRDGRASFLHEHYTCRKFGTLGIYPKMEIKVDCLQRGDILVFGSDGRDDLLVTRPNGEKRMNEDETQFLQIVEEAEGSLDRIVLGLTEKGEITDDLSLIVVEYLRDEEKLSRETMVPIFHEEENLENFKKIIFTEIKNKNYKKALETAKNLFEKYPADRDLLYLASYTAKMAYEFTLAIEYGETLRLRDPFFVKNLINLADVYFLTQNYKRTIELLAEAEEIEPDNRELLRFKSKIQSSKEGLSVS